MRLSIFFLFACSAQQPAHVERETKLFESGDAIGYAIQDPAGASVGRIHSRYGESDGKRTIVTRVALAGRTHEYATTLASDLHPLAFERLSSSDGRMSLSFETNGVTRATDLGSEQLPALTADLVPADDPMLLALVLAKARVSPGQSAQLSVLTPDRSEPESWVVQVYLDAGRNTIVQLPLGKATLNSRGQIVELIAPDGGKLVRLDQAGDPPALLPMPKKCEYVRPSDASWIDREVVIPIESGQLAGVLSEPRLRSKWKKNEVPGIVFLSDVPPQNRHGFAAGVDHGTWQIFDHLAEQGFAVLRVDDRGVGASKSTIPAERISVPMQIADTKAAIDFMKRQASIDPAKIFLIGHGSGAIAAMLAAKQCEVRGLVLIAPPYRRAQAELGDLEARALTKDVTMPVAVLQGFKDFEVSWRDDAKPLAHSFAKNQVKLFVYEFVDHLLKEESGVSSPARYADSGRRIDRAVLDDLSNWLTEKSE